MSLFTHWVICKGGFNGRPYDGPLCQQAGVIPGRVYDRPDEAFYEAEADAKRLDSLGRANFYVYCWYDEEGILARGERGMHGRVFPKYHELGFSHQGHHHSRRAFRKFWQPCVAIGSTTKPSRQQPTPGTPLVQRNGVLVPIRR